MHSAQIEKLGCNFFSFSKRSIDGRFNRLNNALLTEYTDRCRAAFINLIYGFLLINVERVK